jgi:small conductance mechanosensitive channel
MLPLFIAFANEVAETVATETASLAKDAGDASFFAQLSDSLQSWVQKGPVAYLVTLITGLLLIVIGKLLIFWFCRFLKKAFSKSKKINDLMARFVIQVVNIFGWVILVILFLQHMGINMAPVLTGLGITGVILGLAFQETIGNLLSGVMIVIIAPFRIGDYIDSGSFSGTVTDMDLICITLSTPDNKKITLSNRLVWGSPIVNYSDMEKRRVDLLVSVAYGTDVQKVKDIVYSILATYPEILPDPAPMVEVHKLNASSVDFIVRPWSKPEDYWKIYWRFQGEIGKKLADAGVSIPFDQLDIHLVPNSITVVNGK